MYDVRQADCTAYILLRALPAVRGAEVLRLLLNMSQAGLKRFGHFEIPFVFCGLIMKNRIFIILLALLPTLVLAQRTKAPPAKLITPKVTTFYYKLGDDQARVRIFQYGANKDLFFINLHDDEITAVSGAKRVLEKNGGTLVKVENYRQRNIKFKMNGKSYVFDPNRIFSRTGSAQSLAGFGRSDKEAIDEVERFGKRILKLLPPPSVCIISLHNNTEGKFSITSFLPGNERQRDAKAIQTMPNEDPDDLFLTTDSVLYQRLKREKYNAVWQNNLTVVKDGSLSVYCGEKNICYLNCESEHGRLKQYADMITLASQLVRAKATEMIAYNYQLFPVRDSINFSEAFDIYFGEKKIGFLQPSDGKKSSAKYGRLEVAKTFPLFDNMDFYYFASRKPSPRVEMRIDPTRAKSPHDPGKAVILVRVIP